MELKRELIFTMLGEASTTEIAKNKNAQGFVENKKAAKAGGDVAGKARIDLEQKSGKKIVNPDNFLGLQEKNTLKQFICGTINRDIEIS